MLRDKHRFDHASNAWVVGERRGCAQPVVGHTLHTFLLKMLAKTLFPSDPWNFLAGCAQLHEFTVLFLLFIELPYSCTRTALRAPWPSMGVVDPYLLH